MTTDQYLQLASVVIALISAIIAFFAFLQSRKSRDEVVSLKLEMNLQTQEITNLRQQIQQINIIGGLFGTAGAGSGGVVSGGNGIATGGGGLHGRGGDVYLSNGP